MAGKPRARVEPPLNPSSPQRTGRAIDEPNQAEVSGSSWPTWARVLATLALLFHISAVLAGSFGVPPSSELERGLADLFTPYHELFDQGYAYRYYAEPPPTPVITATLEFSDGRPAREVRLPERDLSGPSMRHQRQLALAHALFSDYQEAKQASGEGERSRWGRAFAKHLCRANPGCRAVTLRVRQHLMPDVARAREHYARRGAKAIDLFDESLFTTPERIGDYPCDGF